MLGLLFLTAALQRVAQIVLCCLMIGSRGGIDFVQNTEKFQAQHNSCVHLVIKIRPLRRRAIAYDFKSKPR